MQASAACSHHEATLGAAQPEGRGLRTSWLRPLKGAYVGAEVMLVLLPHAGGSAYSFVPWVPFLPERALAFAVEYPGHGSRMRERPETDANSLCESILGHLAHVSLPIVFGGHSLGAMLAYELAVRYQGRGGDVGGVLLSAAQPPHRLGPRFHHASLADAELAQRLDVPLELLDDAESLELFVSLARADLDLSSSLAAQRRPGSLDTSALVIGGRQDERVSTTELMQWSDLLRGRTTFRFFDGPHFFHQAHMPELEYLIDELVPGGQKDGW